jgi:hypothetical protein
VALLAGQVVLLVLDERSERSRPTAIEPPAIGTELPADPWREFPRLAPAPDRTSNSWGAPRRMADIWRLEPLATPAADPLQLPPLEEAVALLDGPGTADSSEETAVDSVPGEANAVPREPMAAPLSPAGFLDTLDLSLDVAPGGDQTRAPALALPEPGLARNLSPSGTSSPE